MGKTKDIKNIIAGFIEEVSGTSENIRKVYSHFEPMPSEFPCVMVFLKNINEDRLDFQDNQVDADYQIKLCVPFPANAKKSVLEDLRLDCIDDIMARLRKKDALETLGGEVFQTKFSAGEPYIETEAELPMLITDFTFETSRAEFIEQ